MTDIFLPENDTSISVPFALPEHLTDRRGPTNSLRIGARPLLARSLISACCDGSIGKEIFTDFPAKSSSNSTRPSGECVVTIPATENAAVARTVPLVLNVAAMQGTFFVHADENGFHIGPGVPTGIPVSEIRAIGYTGPRSIAAESVADLKKWFEERLDDGFKFDLLDCVNGT